MTTLQAFQKLPISYLGANFKAWFGSIPFNEKKKVKPLVGTKLPRAMNNAEIQAELKPDTVSMEEIAETLKTLDYSVWAIFYAKDKDGVLRAVYVYWCGDGWGTGADALDGDGWGADYRVFSRNSLSLKPSAPTGSSDALTLDGKEITIDGKKYTLTLKK